MRAASWLFTLSVLASLGCAERRAPPASVAPPPPVETPPEAPPPVATPVTAAPAIVTGILIRRASEIEICPQEQVSPCPGIRIEGKVDDAWLSEVSKVSKWRLRGRFDGTTLRIDAPAEAAALSAHPEFGNDCPEFQQPPKRTKDVHPDLELVKTVEALAQENSDRVAGFWWDRQRQTMVISITGDPALLQQQVRERAPGARICVQGRARRSEAELERIRAKADEILREHGVYWTSSFGDVMRSQVIYEDVEAIDAVTLAELARVAGDAVHVDAFIELVEHTLEQMPKPPMKGDVALLTNKSRGFGGMSALGVFKVGYDPVLRCVYFGTAEDRTLPFWPFGTWATSNPLTVYDYDGNVIAKEGETIEIGGGLGGDINQLRADNLCGAKQVWYGRIDPRDPTRKR